MENTEIHGGDEVIPGANGVGAIWIGGYGLAHDLAQLKANRIGAVVSSKDTEFTLPADILNLDIPIEDKEDENLAPHYDAVFNFMEAQLKNTNVLVQCKKGISRSTALALSYIMKKHGLSYDEAIERVRKNRACVKPNPGFEKQLREYSKITKPQA